MLHHLKPALTCAALLLSTGAGIAQTASKTVTVGWGSYNTDAPQVVVAAGKGYFKEAGIEVKLIPFQTGRDGFEALIGGQLDVNIMAEFPVVAGAMRKQPFSVLAVLSRYKANRLITTQASGASTMAGLASKKIGLPVGTNVQFMVDEDLKTAGVKAQLVNLAPSDLAPALLRGDVDAIGTFPSLFGGVRRTLGDRYSELPLSPYATTFLLVGSKDFQAKSPDTAGAFLGAIAKATEFMAANPAAAQEIIAKAAGKALTLETIKSEWTNYSYDFGLDPALVDLLSREGSWIRERGMIKDVEPTAALFRSVINDAPLKQAAPGRATLP